MKRFLFFLILYILFCFCACSKFSPKLELYQICWEGENLDYKSCVPLYNSEELNLDDDYNYPDPRTDPSFNYDIEKYLFPIRFVDLKVVNSIQKLSKNFVLDEFMSLSKGRAAIFSSPVVSLLQRMRDEIDCSIIITSGYRSPGYNNSIEGSAKFSRHIYGDAVDIISNCISLDQLNDLCTEYGGYARQYISSHVHCDWRNLDLDDHFFMGKVNSKLLFDKILLTKQKNLQQKKIEQKYAYIEILSGKIGHNNEIVMLGDLRYHDDPDYLMVDWEIIDPDNKILYRRENPLIFTFSKKGIYQFNALISHNFIVSKEYLIK